MSGDAFVKRLLRWVELGHITVEEGGPHAANATALIDRYSKQLLRWIRSRCKEMQPPLLRDVEKLRRVRATTVVGIVKKLDAFGKSAISHMVDRREFWAMPGKIAMLTEEIVPLEMRSCAHRLEAAAGRAGVNITGALQANSSAMRAASGVGAAGGEAAGG
eukprot:2026145-Pleurochrysis_carterae.AAC.1